MSRKRHFANVCWISLVLMVGPFMRVSLAQDLPPEVLGYADTVFYNGQVLTMDRDQPPINVTQAIAVRIQLIRVENTRTVISGVIVGVAIHIIGA